MTSKKGMRVSTKSKEREGEAGGEGTMRTVVNIYGTGNLVNVFSC